MLTRDPAHASYRLAEKAGITKKQAGEILEHIAQLAYKNAKNSFTCSRRWPGASPSAAAAKGSGGC